jgi:hypothetical protein
MREAKTKASSAGDQFVVRCERHGTATIIEEGWNEAISTARQAPFCDGCQSPS